MEAADLVVCTGSQKNVKQAYASGKPALGDDQQGGPPIEPSFDPMKEIGQHRRRG